MPDIKQARIIILSTDGFEQSELEVPRDKLSAAGATVHVVSPDGETIRGWDKTDWGQDAEVDHAVSDVSPDDYDAIVLPGGQINPDILRTKPEAVEFVKKMHNAGKVVAAICHGPWMLVEAGVVKGRKVTSFPSIKTDLVNAGGQWEDSEVVTDKGIVTSRKPDDLDAFVSKIIEEVQEGKHDRAAA
ncbi:putative intracellular protease, PfpI family protein [Pseudooceanicola batsensis HTCC2597]|uniref:Putative intracellular protease, PfpI family protein n=1 Tax=Pseudooceanicola batsensis (strain ATCC BAA-863 / DSM 15984 / KCTC 12145 / HTCC2597) TaxID=252305 RepID=A3TXS4_PSEBH|nr:type 1 glutamine amidotransferase domain-containing protein [Pseudooceanicola batsensis]EAQ03634.1 putative intracellular protease, PfpI family protein [Pseudooceanicola batsensis HTCC2597]